MWSGPQIVFPSLPAADSAAIFIRKQRIDVITEDPTDNRILECAQPVDLNTWSREISTF
jgi:hypothetical protein